jgi:hypothetical protein
MCTEFQALIPSCELLYTNYDKRVSCCFQVNDISISSYPDERSSPGEAMHLVAKQAVEELYSHIRETGGGGTQDENTIMTRILHVGTRLDYKIPR